MKPKTAAVNAEALAVNPPLTDKRPSDVVLESRRGRWLVHYTLPGQQRDSFYLTPP